MEVIQFIAHHDLQAQTFQGILPYLSEHELIISIGQDVEIHKRTTVIVVADHLDFQRNILSNKSCKLVHISHDVADLEVYAIERSFLSFFDLILCPSLTHFEICKSMFPDVPAFPVGWQNNAISFSNDSALLDMNSKHFNHALLTLTLLLIFATIFFSYLNGSN